MKDTYLLQEGNTVFTPNRVEAYVQTCQLFQSQPHVMCTPARKATPKILRGKHKYPPTKWANEKKNKLLNKRMVDAVVHVFPLDLIFMNLV